MFARRRNRTRVLVGTGSVLISVLIPRAQHRGTPKGSNIPKNGRHHFLGGHWPTAGCVREGARRREGSNDSKISSDEIFTAEDAESAEKSQDSKAASTTSQLSGRFERYRSSPMADGKWQTTGTQGRARVRTFRSISEDPPMMTDARRAMPMSNRRGRRELAQRRTTNASS